MAVAKLREELINLQAQMLDLIKDVNKALRLNNRLWVAQAVIDLLILISFVLLFMRG